MIAVTISDRSGEIFPAVLRAIPKGYTVALLGPGQDLSDRGEIVPGVDVEIVATDPAGLAYRDLSADGSTPVGPIRIRPWEEILRVHVY